MGQWVGAQKKKEKQGAGREGGDAFRAWHQAQAGG